MKGLLLAGGFGSRLAPLTAAVSKQLLPVYDKPMIYYPLSSLMLAGIKEILVICAPSHLKLFELTLGSGSQWGISLNYAVQQAPEGVPQSLLIAEEFLGGSKCCLALGDNFFYGDELTSSLQQAARLESGAIILACPVSDPSRYGVLTLNKEGIPSTIDEKPSNPSSNLAVTGLYFYDETACLMARDLKPSDRGELEISDLNRAYLERGQLTANILGRGMAWMDLGTTDSLLEAGIFISTLEKRQGLKIACLEEIAFANGWIDTTELKKACLKYKSTPYGTYLASLLHR